MKAILLSGTLALVLSLFVTRWAIRQFAAWGLGQLIREDGPRSHHVKRGTPTMGGAAVVASVVVGYAVAKLATWEAPSRSALLVLFLLVGMAGVGFLDDFIKVRMQRSLGLRSRAKLVGQTRRRGRVRVPGARSRRAGRDGGRRVAPAVARA